MASQRRCEAAPPARGLNRQDLAGVVVDHYARLQRALPRLAVHKRDEVSEGRSFRAEWELLSGERE